MATLGVPQAAGPIAFSLLALSRLGDASAGAAMMLGMTLAQVAGAMPITRLGRNLAPTSFLRLLVVVRTVALASIALSAACEASLAWLIAGAAVAGSVNGAAYGHLRSALNRLVPGSRLPRSLGIAATLNEVTFVLAPVAASGLGSISPVFGVLAIAALGAAPALLVPHVAAAQIDRVPHVGGSVLSPSILVWLACAVAGGAAVAAVEIGAVSLALRFGYEPALAILFTVPLCLASVTGGIWISIRNRTATRTIVLAQLSVMTLGSALVALGTSVGTTVVGAVLTGSVLAPLGTYYSLILDKLAPPGRRPEVFALLRTANSVGIILASAILTAVSLPAALVVITCVMIAVTLAVGLAPLRRHR